MKKNIILTIVGLGVLASLSACGFAAGQLADKAQEEQLLKPGALDAPMTGYYDSYSFKLLDKYRVTHDWPVVSNCKYRKQPTLNRSDRFRGEVYAVRDIYEDQGKTWQRFDPQLGPYDFDRFVRPSYKTQRPEFDAAGKKTGRMLEKNETGLEPVCFEAWVGTSHSTALRLYKSSLNERIAFYSKRPGKQSRETIGAQTWWVWRYPIDDGSPKAYGGEAWVRPIGDTGYTLALELGAGHESLKFPQAHANFQAMFRHLLESVKIEEIKP